MVSSSNSKLMTCRENARASKLKSSRRLSSSCDKLSDFTTQCGIDTAMVTKLEEGGVTQSKKIHKSQTQIQNSRKQVQEIVLSDTFCFIDLFCEIFDGVSIGNVSQPPRQCCHRNRHHRPRKLDASLCGSRHHFRSILTLTLACIQFILLLLLLSPHKHHLKWSFLERVCNSDLESVQEQNFLLPCVPKCFSPG